MAFVRWTWLMLKSNEMLQKLIISKSVNIIGPVHVGYSYELGCSLDHPKAYELLE